MKNNKVSFSSSPLVIGTMRLGEWGTKMTIQELEYFVDECIALGLVDFDHADIYGDYTTEADFGRLLRQRPDLRQKVRLTTKCGIRLVTPERPAHTIKSYDSTKKHILSSVDASLQNLGIEQIELFLLHRPDYLMNPQEIAQAVEKLKIAGKIKHFGVSNFSASQFELLHAFTPLATNQIEISLTHLEAFQNGTLDQCLLHGIAPTAWSPFGGGKLFSNNSSPRIKRIQQVAQKIAKRYEVQVEQILLAFLYKHPSQIIPIIGSSKINRLKLALQASKIVLKHEEWYELFEASSGKEVP